MDLQDDGHIARVQVLLQLNLAETAVVQLYLAETAVVLTYLAGDAWYTTH
jgi:hypothetical protein